MTVEVGGTLSIDDVLAAARGEPVALAPQAHDRMLAARRVVDDKLAARETVYGVTTGFGALADVHLTPEQARQLQHSLLRSHAVGVGAPLSEWEVRAMLVLRAHVLALGHSGVRPIVVERLLEFLNRSILPVVPEQGSLGASGDLAPLAHLALPLIGEGDVAYDGRRMPASEALKGPASSRSTSRPKRGSRSSTAHRPCWRSASSRPPAVWRSRRPPTWPPP